MPTTKSTKPEQNLSTAMSPPTGVVTFLFTDIEGSTRRWESDADAMRAALAAHDKVLRSAIEAHDGFVFSHSGDGMAAAFASPMSAVGAAIDAQRELQLPVRMGIATGEAELRDNDYFGTVLNRAARVMAAGHGGQILIADSTAGLVGGIELLNLGPRRLRDVANPVTLFQLQAAGLRTDFPPLRTVDPLPGNLRTAASNLIGRDAEIGEIASVLRQRRLVTLTGVGGVGKTRLALEVAAQLADEFPDGVWVFELAAVNDPAAVPDAVAATLGVTQQPGMGVGESVAAALEGRVRLLVFDNCEHVLDATAGLIEAIIAASSTVRIIATSREGLSVADEQVWPLRSLDADAAMSCSLNALAVSRRTSRAGKTDAVAEICARLDRIPLAIELAASRMASMSADEVRDRLDHRFKLLVGSRRGLERHQTLRHAVAWSYDLLDGTEKSLLDRCSVFAGGFDLQSACAVVESERATSTRSWTAGRTRAQIASDCRSLTGCTRYSMLETIRQFAEDQLVTSGAAADARTAHARYFAGREAEIMALWDSPRQREAYDWFATELANLRSAFRWAADRGQLDVAAVIATYTFVPALALENQEPSGWAEELIEAARLVDHPRLGFLYLAAALCWMSGRLDNALVYNREAQEQIRVGRSGVPFGLEGLLGGLYMVIGQVEKALEWEDEYLDAQSDPLAISRSNRLIQLVMAGRIDDAIASAPEVLAAADTSNPHAHFFGTDGRRLRLAQRQSRQGSARRRCTASPLPVTAETASTKPI